MMEDKMSPKTKAQEPKKTFSLKFRFIATVIIAMLSITIFVGGLSVYEVDKYIQTQAEEFVKVTCDNEGAQINDKLSNMEKSVKIMESYLMDFFFSKADVEDKAVQEKVVKSADEMFVDVAKHTSTSGAVSYYFRFDPAISDGKAGLFYSKINGSTDFVSLEPTDITIYEKNDTEHVGWFWQPYEAGTPIWMDPYYNQNNEILMISYVIPMYYEDKFIGVVGMDFDYDVLSDMVNGIKIYDNGFAHLEVDGTVISSSDSALEAKINSGTKKYLRMSNDLVNGMTLVLSASYDDIRSIRYDIAFKIIYVVILLAAFFALIVILIVRKIVYPLKTLTDASVKLSNGDYNIEITHSNTYEIKLLSTAFENMIQHLKEHERLQHLLAYRDSLTGLRNTNSYKTWVTDFDKEIKNEKIDFGVAMLDINTLRKQTTNMDTMLETSLLRLLHELYQVHSKEVLFSELAEMNFWLFFKTVTLKIIKIL